jgi:quercetin dioxygenase-like cupin family protein
VNPRTPRRIVTALDQEGLSRLARIEDVAEDDYSLIDPRSVAVPYPRWAQGEHPEIRVVWGHSGLPPRFPNDASTQTPGGFPQPGDLRVSLVTYAPGHEGEFFWADTFDVVFVVAGELTYETDGGETMILREGDVVLQYATNKALHNRGTRPATIGTVMIGGRRVGPTPPRERQIAAPKSSDRGSESDT